MTAHMVGQELGFGSRTLGWQDHHIKNLAKSVRAKPGRMVGVIRDAEERRDFMVRDGRTRRNLQNVSRQRERRMAPSRARSEALRALGRCSRCGGSMASWSAHSTCKGCREVLRAAVRALRAGAFVEASAEIGENSRIDPDAEMLRNAVVHTNLHVEGLREVDRPPGR